MNSGSVTDNLAAQSKKQLATIHTLLAKAYGEPEWKPHRAPVDELVCTILSQSTSDVNRDMGYQALRARFPEWKSVMTAAEAEVIEAIRPAGLANQKGPRIQAALRQIYEERGEISLDFLSDLSLNEAKAWLMRIRGVGPKTAAIVLLFAFGRPAFPVDTHVHRITRRLGLIGPKVTADRAHTILENMGDPEIFYPFHLNLIRHGREVCVARKPRCEICALKSHCQYYAANYRT